MTSTTLPTHDLGPLRNSVTGSVLAPGDDGWDAARQAWNVLADQNPAGVVFAESAADVAASVEFARRHGLRVAPQGTGHAATALEPLDDTLLLKTMRMGAVTVDPGARTARVEAGALWGDVAVAAGEHGLAALAGSSPDVGVIGYSLGGGIGWLARAHGLAANSVTAIEVVTAEGEVVRADADHEPDLFWALRGGGGSFGVVTALEMRLLPIAEIYAGSYMVAVEHGAEMFHAYREWTAGMPREMTSGMRFLTLPPIPEVPEPLRGRSVVDLTVAYDGDPAEGARLVEPLRAIAEPIVDMLGTIPAAGLCRVYGDPEQPTPGIAEHALLGELDAAAIDTLVDVAGPESGSPLLMVALRQLGGALAEAPAGAGALATLDGEFVMQTVGIPMGPGAGPAIEAHIERVLSAMEPWSTGRSYLNFADSPSDASAAFDEDTYRRLREVKARLDADDLFRSNHPVR